MLLGVRLVWDSAGMVLGWCWDGVRGVGGGVKAVLELGTV